MSLINDIKSKINFRQPKYMLPAILYIPLLGTGWAFCNVFTVEKAEIPDGRETTEYLNPNLPGANIKGDGIGGKYDNMKNSFGMIADASAVNNIDRNEEEQKEDYESKYSEEELANINAEAERQAELARQKSAEKAGQSAREQEALAELERALAQARLQAQASVPNVGTTSDDADSHTVEGSAEVKGKINLDARKQPAEDAEATEVVKKVKVTSDYFNTLAANEKEPNMIKAIIDENIKAVDGSRVRLRLLDDVEIAETVVRKGSYLYAIMSGFGSQRVKGTIKSVMVDDEIIKINLALYDVDGLEGLYVPSSSFRETSKDVASGAMSGQMSMNNGTTGNSLAQWGMQAAQNAYQKTSSAISKAIKKNKVSLKYGTHVYLINSKDTKTK